MEDNCTTSVVPNLVEDKCKGKQGSTDCIIFEKGIPYLSIPEGANLTIIVETLLLSLVDARTRIKTLESDVSNLNSRLTTLE